MTVHRGRVSAVDTAGVFVRVAALGPDVVGPLEWLGTKPGVDEGVLVLNAGSESAPDLVVLPLWHGGPPPDFGLTSRVMQVSSGADGYAALLVDSEGRVLQLLASDHNGVAAIGTRSNDPLTLCTDDTTRVTILTGGGRVVLNAGGADAGLAFLTETGPRDMAGTGPPEGAVSAPVGSTWRRSDGGAGTSFYVKESGTGTTGWVGK